MCSAQLFRPSPSDIYIHSDNNMLLGGPAANFLVQQLTNLKGTPRPELSFLSASSSSTCTARTPADFLSADVQLSLVSYRAGRLVRELRSLRSSPVSDASKQAYLDAALAARASRAAGAFLISYAFITKLGEASSSPSSRGTPAACSCRPSSCRSDPSQSSKPCSIIGCCHTEEHRYEAYR